LWGNRLFNTSVLLGNGFATEMASKLNEICFKDIKLHKVSASCNVNNVQSRKVMEKVGKIKEGELRKVDLRTECG